MKLHLPHKLLAALVAAVLAPAVSYGTSSELGDIMYVGDSITHGVNSASWRWAMHKIFTDNGISYTSVGYKTGNYSGGVGATATYGGAVFQNVHSSQASARAWEIAGRKAGGRFDNTNLQNWLGQSSTKTNGQAYTAATHNPDAFYLLIGTNDLLSDTGSLTSAANLESKTTGLLGAADANGVRSGGDMKTILDSMYAKNANAPVTILSIPCWTRHANSNSAAEHSAVQTYNDELKKWVANYNATTGKNALLVDVNKGMVDVASATPFYGCESMFGKPGSDGLHPSAQGDLIMAGTVAKAQGYAGRTAGQERMAASEFSLYAADFTLANATLSGNDITLAAGGTATLSWDAAADLSSGYTVDFSLANGLGNGATDGWDTASLLSISVGDGSMSGTLSISEAYIKWGDKVLYSMDMSGATDSTAYTVYDTAESIRMAYVNGNTGLGLDSGYYIWLGDMLIGEACAGTEGANLLNGISITNGTGSSVTLAGLSAATQAYAPTTTLYSAGNPLFKPYNPEGKDPATMQWSETTATTVTLATSGNVINGVAKADDGAFHVSLSQGTSSTNVYLSNAAVSGDLWAEISGGTSTGTNSFCGVKQGKALTGNAYFRVSDTHEGSGQWGTWFGALNGGSISGDLYMEFSSANWDTAAGTYYGTSHASVAGAYGAGVGGKVTMVFNAGTFRSGIWGGNLNGNYTIGSTDVHIYGGTIMDNIHAGSAAGTISNGAALTFTGENYALNGVTKISAGGTGGTINGGTTLTIDGMDASSSAAASGYGISGYTGELSGSDGGTVNGQRTLAFKNSTHQTGFAAQLRNFDRITFTKSDISLGAGTLGGASTLELDTASTLTLTEGTYENMHVSSSGTIVLKGADLSITAEGNDSQVSGTYRVDSGSLGLGDGYITQSTYVINGGALTLGDGVEMKGSLTVASGASITVAQGANATISGTATIHHAAISGTLSNNGTVTLTGVRNQTIDLSHFTGNGTIVLDNTGINHITVGDTTPSSFAGTIQVDTTGYWFFFNGTKQPFAADADGHYASLNLRSTAATPSTGLAMGSKYTYANALAIGNLSGDAGVAVCGSFTTGANVNRFLDVHQDKDTTFAGKFLNDGNNCVGLIKHGEGNLTLTGANASTAKLEILEGTVTLSGPNGAWAGNISVADGATLQVDNRATLNLATGITLSLEGSLAIADGSTLSGGGVLSKTGAGELDLTGKLQGFTGGLDVQAGSILFCDKGGAGQTVSGVSISISGDGSIVFGNTEADSVTLGAKTGQTATVESSIAFNSANGGIGGTGTISQAKVDFTGEADQNVASTVNFQNCTISNSSSGNVTINGELKGDITVDNGTVTYVGTEAVTVEEGKSFEVSNTGELSFSKGEGESQAVVTIMAQNENTAANVSSGVTFNSEAGAITGSGTLTNAVVEFSGKAEQTVSADISLNGCSIVNAGESLVSISVNTKDTSYALLHAQNSSITLLQAGDLTVGEIKLNEGQIVSAFTGTDANVTPATGNEATITLTNLTVEGNATLNANLVFGNEQGDAYSLVMLGTVAMGSDVYLFTGGTLEVVEGVKMQVLFTSVDNLYINGVQIKADGEIFADRLFTNAVAMSGIRWNLEDDGWTVTYYDYIPEPATATLSLLALAALAARRRRKH